MTRDQLINERASVVAALEMPGLSPEQRVRGWKRFDEIAVELKQLDQPPQFDNIAREHLDKIRETLSKKREPLPFEPTDKELEEDE